jgi:glyoxylase-like metal-dependent hydrolase (beta-lactamase superfamily II)
MEASEMDRIKPMTDERRGKGREHTMRILSAILTVVALGNTNAFAQMPQPMIQENTTKISDHVWAIMGFPNIAIVVGSHATLVVDTGLGPKNGATVARVATKLAPNNTKLFLTTTHFHPEHAAGEPGFPPSTILIRNAVQQQEMEKHGQGMIDQFAKFSAQNQDLLGGVVLRPPDVAFDQEATVDLGGVTARLLWFGGAHTKGDELTFVEPDRTLISGDVVQNKTMPNIFGDGGTPASWLAVLDKVSALNAAHILPDHSSPGDGSLVAEERALISGIRTQALALKSQGISAEDAGKQISADLKTQHPDWPNTNATGFVKSVYAESATSINPSTKSQTALMNSIEASNLNMVVLRQNSERP